VVITGERCQNHLECYGFSPIIINSSKTACLKSGFPIPQRCAEKGKAQILPGLRRKHQWWLCATYPTVMDHSERLPKAYNPRIPSISLPLDRKRIRPSINKKKFPLSSLELMNRSISRSRSREIQNTRIQTITS